MSCRINLLYTTGPSVNYVIMVSITTNYVSLLSYGFSFCIFVVLLLIVDTRHVLIFFCRFGVTYFSVWPVLFSSCKLRTCSANYRGDTTSTRTICRSFVAWRRGSPRPAPATSPLTTITAPSAGIKCSGLVNYPVAICFTSELLSEIF